MATKINDETIDFTLEWKIENIHHCWLKRGECMLSPVYSADALKGTEWMLHFYPMGYHHENKLEFYLYRQHDDTGKKIVQANYRLAFVDKSGSILQEIQGLPNKRFVKGSKWGFQESKTRDFVFGRGKEAYLPEDTLTVRCTLWETTKKPYKVEHLYARTVYHVNRKSFLWRMEKFSTLNARKKYNFNGEFNLDFFITDDQEKLDLKFNFQSPLKYFSFKTSLVDSAGKIKNRGTHEYFQEDLRTGVLCTLLFTEELLKNKSLYLPNDVLTLKCDCVFSTGTFVSELCDFLMESLESTNKIAGSINERNAKKGGSQNFLDLTEDLKSIYIDGDFSDIEVRTSTKTFPAHKNILAARSPVFRNLFRNDRKVRNSGYVDIEDFEDDTVRQMLLYMYTDSLGDLQLENASSLYKIADKYHILSLRNKCSSFLKGNLCPTNACHVLALADLHDDDDLKRSAEDYIKGNRKQFFFSEEWKEFMKTHTDIAANIIYRKIYPE